MADLNRTIDRSIRISRSVSDLLQRRLRAAGERYVERVRAAQTLYRESIAAPEDALRVRAAVVRVHGRRCAAIGAVLGHAAPARQQLARAREGRQAAAARLSSGRWSRTRARSSGPVNYALVRIVPPRRRRDRPDAAPFVIIDPRAGHGPGIGGFKEDSRGRRRAAARAIRSTSSSSSPIRCRARRSPTSPTPRPSSCASSPSAIPTAPKPVLVGNCQGGWAVMMLAARAARHRRPDRHQRRADVVLGGQRRRQSDALRRRPARRHMARRCSRAISAAASSTAPISSQNFENLNPANTYLEKYYHLFANDRHGARALPRVRALVGRLLPDERGGDPLDRQQPLRRQQARRRARRGSVRGATSTCKSIKQPIIVFASMGDNITPPQQAFNWIADLYSIDRGDQGERADDRRPDARGHRPPRHLRVGPGREEGARADRRGAEVHPAAAAGPLRHADRGARSASDGAVDVRRDAARAQGRGPASAAEIRSRRREAVRGRRGVVGADRARVLAARAARRARGDRPNGSRKALRDCHPLRVQRWAISDKQSVAVAAAARRRHGARAAPAARAATTTASKLEKLACPNT